MERTNDTQIIREAPFSYLNQIAKMNTFSCFPVKMGCCVYINEGEKTEFQQTAMTKTKREKLQRV